MNQVTRLVSLHKVHVEPHSLHLARQSSTATHTTLKLPKLSATMGPTYKISKGCWLRTTEGGTMPYCDASDVLQPVPDIPRKRRI